MKPWDSEGYGNPFITPGAPRNLSDRIPYIWNFSPSAGVAPAGGNLGALFSGTILTAGSTVLRNYRILKGRAYAFKLNNAGDRINLSGTVNYNIVPQPARQADTGMILNVPMTITDQYEINMNFSPNNSEMNIPIDLRMNVIFSLTMFLFAPVGDPFIALDRVTFGLILEFIDDVEL